MKTAKRALSALMVLAMLMSCMGATTFTAGDEQQPDGNAQVIEVSPSVGEPQVSEPASEPQTSEPAGEPQESEPAGEPQESEPADAPQESEPAGEPQASEPANEPQVSESAGGPEAEETTGTSTIPTFSTLSISAPAPIAQPPEEATVEWTGTEGQTYNGQTHPVTATMSGATDYTEEPTITYAGRDGTTYTDSANAPTDAGDYTATAKWTSTSGDTTYEESKEFTIAPADLTVNTTYTGNNQTYKGSAYTVADLVGIGAEVNGIQNSESITATAVLRGDAIDVGTYTVGYELSWGNAKETNYAVKDGTLATVTIDKLSLELDISKAKESTFTYSGSNIVLDYTGVMGLGVASTDALTTVETNIVDAGTHTTVAANSAVITAIRNSQTVDVHNNYDITLTGTLTVTAKPLKTEMVAAIGDQTYTGSPIEIDPTITDSDRQQKLVKGTDYTLDYSSNTNVGKATVTITGKDNYSGKVETTFEIVPQSIEETSKVTVTITPPENLQYNEQVKEAAVTVTFTGEPKTLEKGKHYTVTYEPADPTGAGTVTVTVKGTGNFSGTVVGTYDITRKPLANEMIKVTGDVVPYNGIAQTPAIEVSDGQTPLVPDKDYENVTYTNNTNAGTATVTITGKGNYSGTASATFVIPRQSIGDKSVTNDWNTFAQDFDNANKDGFIYDGTEHKWKPQFQFTKGDGTTVSMTDTGDYTVAYSVNDFTNVTKITVTVNGTNNFDGTVTHTYCIEPKEVTVTAAGTKLFGAKDAAAETVENPEAAPTGDNWYQVQINGLVETDKGKSLITVTPDREEGEVPGAYDITLTVDASKATNYKVKDLTAANELVMDDDFVIADQAAFTVVLGEENVENDINTHTLSVDYTIKPAAGQDLIPELQDALDVQLKITKGEETFVAPDPEPDPAAPSVPVTPNIRETLSQETGADVHGGAFVIPPVNYIHEGEGGTVMTWQSGLPVNTTLTLIVAPKDQAEAKAAQSVEKTVFYVPVSLAITPSSPDGMYTLADGSVLLNANGTVNVSLAVPEPGAQATDEGSVTGDWLDLQVGANHWYFRWSDVATAFPVGGSIALPALLEALGGGDWYGNVPTAFLPISITMVDNVNHNVTAAAANVAFDVGGENSSEELANRLEDEAIVLKITDSVNTDLTAAVEGVYGGSTPAMEVAAGQQGTITWNNVTEWKDTPDTLPHSGDSFTVQYRDLVGNPVTHTVNVVRSNAVTSNTLYVQPITSNTVPGKALTFFGDTNVWEAGVLTIGGRTYNIEPLAGGATYDNSAKRWQYIVTLGDINFPVGVPTTVSMAYEDLNGGEASIVITYKDQAQTPVLSSEPVAGSQTLWGYVESSASVSVSIYHADGSITQVPQDNIAVDQFGYFYVRLGSPLAEGEQVSISTRDFCDNQKFITVNVQKELEPNAAAEVLGANIVDELENTDDIYHRFATPIDLGALAQAENKSMTLPILAYKGIEIGEITFTLNDQGELNVTYTIKSTSFVPDGAKARMATFTSKPTIDQLVRGEMPVVVSDLKTAATGTIPAVDVTAYQADDGSYSGVIWLQAAFDIDMTEDNYISRGGRGASFYRWLTEALQTESVLGAVYKETSAYASNVRYYDLYQTFENISRMS